MDKIEQWIGKIMLISILIAVAILLYGGGLYLKHHGHEMLDDSIFRPEPQKYINLREICQGALAHHSGSIIMLGLMIVIFGQALRVFLTGLIFAYQRDWLFSLFTLFILLILGKNLFFS